MAFIQSLIQRVANVSAKTKILQDKVAGGGIQSGLTKISNKFAEFNLDSTASQAAYEQANESTFRRIELEELGADQEIIDDEAFEETKAWDRFRGSYK